MPFIACLNNVKTTHKRLTSPPPNQRSRPAHKNDTTSQGIASHAYATTSTNTLPAPTTRTSPTASTTERADRSATRCSRPLCRSQTTTPPTPPTPTPTIPTGTNPQEHPGHTGMRNKGRTRSNQPPPPASGGTPTGAPPPVSGGRLILQDPTVCLTPSPTNAGP